MSIGEYSIKAEKRDLKISPSTIRRAGGLPAVIYGKEAEATPIQVGAKAFSQVYRQAGESSLVTLEMPGEEERLILFKEPQHDPRTGDIIHVDFYQIKLGEKIKTNVPLVFEGEAPAIEEFDGVLITNKDEVEIECLPRNLPKDIKVDLSGLKNIDDTILIKNLELPEGVEVLDDPEDSIVVVTRQREEEEEPVVSEEEAVEGIEVEGEKKEERETEEKPAEGETAESEEKQEPEKS